MSSALKRNAHCSCDTLIVLQSNDGELRSLSFREELLDTWLHGPIEDDEDLFGLEGLVGDTPVRPSELGRGDATVNRQNAGKGDHV